MNAPTHGAVIVGIDGSGIGLRAVRWAAREAASMNRPLCLVHASPLETDERVVWVDLARYWVQQAKDVALDEVPHLVVRERFLRGGPAKVLLEEAAEAHELVVGSDGLGGIAGMIIGTVPPTVASHAPCPVVVVRGQENKAGPVVLGVDGSPAGEAAIGYAFDAASRAGVPLHAVHTWSDAELYAMLSAPPIAIDWETTVVEQDRILAERVAGWQEKYPDVAVERYVTSDRPAHQLIEAARHARLLVIGSRGRGGFTSLLLGSTSRTLMHHSPCPLAIVRQPSPR